MQRTSRLKRELQLLSAEPPPGASCWQTEARLDELQAQIVGGADTPHEGGSSEFKYNKPLYLEKAKELTAEHAIQKNKTLVFATLEILSIHEQLVTLQRERKPRICII
uniref:Uncharacterized protein n=1 Tax=Sinocyclocheilus grahami TaxID=75366 RepID=A0A672K9A6_SINGR